MGVAVTPTQDCSAGEHHWALLCLKVHFIGLITKDSGRLHRLNWARENLYGNPHCQYWLFTMSYSSLKVNLMIFSNMVVDQFSYLKICLKFICNLTCIKLDTKQGWCCKMYLKVVNRSFLVFIVDRVAPNSPLIVFIRLFCMCKNTLSPLPAN